MTVRMEETDHLRSLQELLHEGGEEGVMDCLRSRTKRMQIASLLLTTLRLRIEAYNDVWRTVRGSNQGDDLGQAMQRAIGIEKLIGPLLQAHGSEILVSYLSDSNLIASLLWSSFPGLNDLEDYQARRRMLPVLRHAMLESGHLWNMSFSATISLIAGRADLMNSVLLAKDQELGQDWIRLPIQYTLLCSVADVSTENCRISNTIFRSLMQCVFATRLIGEQLSIFRLATLYVVDAVNISAHEKVCLEVDQEGDEEQQGMVPLGDKECREVAEATALLPGQDVLHHLDICGSWLNLFFIKAEPTVGRTLRDIVVGLIYRTVEIAAIAQAEDEPWWVDLEYGQLQLFSPLLQKTVSARTGIPADTQRICTAATLLFLTSWTPQIEGNSGERIPETSICTTMQLLRMFIRRNRASTECILHDICGDLLQEASKKWAAKSNAVDSKCGVMLVAILAAAVSVSFGSPTSCRDVLDRVFLGRNLNTTAKLALFDVILVAVNALTVPVLTPTDVASALTGNAAGRQEWFDCFVDLCKELSHEFPNGQIRCRSLSTLLSLTTQPAIMIPILLKSASDNDKSVRLFALQSLFKGNWDLLQDIRPHCPSKRMFSEVLLRAFVDKPKGPWKALQDVVLKRMAEMFRNARSIGYEDAPFDVMNLLCIEETWSQWMPIFVEHIHVLLPELTASAVMQRCGIRDADDHASDEYVDILADESNSGSEVAAGHAGGTSLRELYGEIVE